MAGLCVGFGVYPSGYTAPSHRPALNKAPVLPDPGAYNKPNVPTKPGARRHLAMAEPGLKWPSPIVKMDEWNNLKGPREEWQINPNRINTFKELPSINRLVEDPDTPYSQEAAVREVVATMSGGAIEPKKSILDIARSFVLTAINPEIKDWWARRVNSLDQLEAIAATRGLTGQETMLRDNIVSEITKASNNVDNLAINAPEFKAPAVPLSIDDIRRATAQAFAAHRTIEQKGLTPAKPAGSPMPPPGSAPVASQLTPVEEKKSPSLAIDIPVSGSPPLKPLAIHFDTTELGPPLGSPTATRSTTTIPPTEQGYIGDVQRAPPNGVIVNINTIGVSEKFRHLMEQLYPKGFDENDGKTWRDPVALISGSGQITSLGQSYVKKKPIGARDFAVGTMTERKNIRKSAIALQYCIENSPEGHSQLEDYIKNPAELTRVFRESANGRFAFNPEYKMNLI